VRTSMLPGSGDAQVATQHSRDAHLAAPQRSVSVRRILFVALRSLQFPR
jgi:hypothetical protein